MAENILSGRERLYVSLGGNGSTVSVAEVGAYIASQIGSDGTKLVHNTDPVTVQNSAGSVNVTGTASIAGTNFHIALPATEALSANGATVPVKNSAGGVTVNGVVAVSAGAISGVSLTATEAILSNSQVLTVPVTGVYISTVTVTVSGGLVTAVALG